METPTQSPISSPVPFTDENLPVPSEISRNSQILSDSDVYLTSNEQMQSDVESIRRVNSIHGITSEEEYLTAGGTGNNIFIIIS